MQECDGTNREGDTEKKEDRINNMIKDASANIGQKKDKEGETERQEQ